MRLRRNVGMAAVAVLLGLVAACSGGDDDAATDASDPSATTTVAEESIAVPQTVAPSTPPTTSVVVAQSPDNQLKFEVTGSCTSAQGVLGNISSGFTPSTPGGRANTFTVAAWYNDVEEVDGKNLDGQPYTNLDTSGEVDARGSAAPWSWECAQSDDFRGDPPGTYRSRITDDDTGRWIEVMFAVGDPAA